MTEIKITKRERFNQIIDVLGDAHPDLVAFCDEQIALLDRKAAKAKETATAKKTEDALLSIVEAALTDEFMTLADIVAKINDPEVSAAKVQARTKKLVEAGVAVKDTIKVDKASRVAFKLA